MQRGAAVGAGGRHERRRRLDRREADVPARRHERRDAAALREADHAVVWPRRDEVCERAVEAVEASLPRVVVRQARLAPPLERRELRRNALLRRAGGAARRRREDKVEGGVRAQVGRELHRQHVAVGAEAVEAEHARPR
eukprot:2712974-Prymnesium_polylepis.1